MEQHQIKVSFSLGTKLLLSVLALILTAITFLDVSTILLLTEDKKAYTYQAQATEAYLVGREFTVGGARLKGSRLCEPCTYLEEKLAIPRSKLSLVHRGGLRCEVVSEGAIKVGDAIRVE